MSLLVCCLSLNHLWPVPSWPGSSTVYRFRRDQGWNSSGLNFSGLPFATARRSARKYDDDVKSNCNISLIIIFYLLFRINMIEMPAQFVSLGYRPTPPDPQAECILTYSRLSIGRDERNCCGREKKSGEVGRRASVLVFFFPQPCVFLRSVNCPNELSPWNRLSVFSSWVLRKHKLSMRWF